MKSVYDEDFSLTSEDLIFLYQKDLTSKLDESPQVFDQNLLNEIVLWKVNRYVKFSDSALIALNSNEINASFIDVNFTIRILNELLETKGVQLPMASTILRFRNPKIYQIVDQRVYRILYKEKLKIPFNKTEQIKLYIKYLDDLKIVSSRLDIPFEKSDRILYLADKRINKDIGLENYGKPRQV